MRQDAIKVEQAGSPGNFEVANWGQAQLDGLRDAILTMAPQVTDGKGMFCKKDAVDAVRQHVHRDHRNRAAEPESIVRLQELCQTLGLSADAEEFPLELADVPSGPDGLAGPSGWRATVRDHSAPIEKPITVTRISRWTGIRAAATIIGRCESAPNSVARALFAETRHSWDPLGTSGCAGSISRGDGRAEREQSRD